MPIPELNESGLLPEGIHDCTLDEISARFGRFQTTDRRVRLFEKLRALVEEERQAGLAVELIVDGSFVTDKPEPGDIDLVIVLPADFDLSVELPPFKYNAISKRQLRWHFPFDVFVVRERAQEHEKRVQYFQQVKDDETLEKRKGLLGIKL
jgi:hypothetical protein